MKKKYLIIGALILILFLAIYLTKNNSQNNPSLSSICNGTLEELKNENPKEFLEIYNKAKNKKSSALSGKCNSGENLKECIERNEIILENMNCMAKFLNQSDLSEKEIKELRELIGE